MSQILKAYTSLSFTSPRAEVSNVLQLIIDASPFSIDQETRKGLIQSLLDDLMICRAENKGRLTPQDAAQAFLAVKTLGKQPSGSEALATAMNLSTLLALSASLKDDPKASSEALRCVANALLLVEDARNNWVRADVGGGKASVELLVTSTTPDQIFLASRILFLCTASATSSESYIRTLVEDKHHGRSIVDIISAKLDALMMSICSGTTMGREAMSDLLKFTFNLLVHYPKMTMNKARDAKECSGNEDKMVMGDCWNHRLDPILAPLLRLFYSLPPTFPGPLAPPLTHVIHSLISIPITPSLRSTWLGLPPPSPRSSANSSPVFQLPDANRNGSAKSGPIDKARSVLAAGRRSLSRSPSPLPSASTLDVVLRAHDLLDVSMSHYLPGDVDPDEPSVREICKTEGDNSLDDILTPLVVLITRLCVFDEGSKMRMRQWVIPADLDRTRPLESRPSLLGRCLRLLGSVYHPRMKDAVGEMLFAFCDSDASTLAAQVGYGNVAGFLFNKGIMNAPTPSSSASLATSSSNPINPITGTFEEKTALPEMTDEEKEVEAEKLFVLFDRLEKTGAIHPSQNPIRKAAQEGKLG